MKAPYWKEDAGSAMRNVTNVIKRLTNIISEIGSASYEKNEGVTQVGTAVAQLDQITQQNATLVEGGRKRFGRCPSTTAGCRAGRTDTNFIIDELAT